MRSSSPPRKTRVLDCTPRPEAIAALRAEAGRTDTVVLRMPPATDAQADLQSCLELAATLDLDRVVLFATRGLDEATRAVGLRAQGLTSVLLSLEEDGPKALEVVETWLDAGLRVNVVTGLAEENVEAVPALVRRLADTAIAGHLLVRPESDAAPGSEALTPASWAHVAEIASRLEGEDDARLAFAGVPYCVVRRPTVRLDTRYVVTTDGVGMLHEQRTPASGRGARTRPAACDARACPLRARCPGFGETHGEAEPLAFAERFLSEIERSPEARRHAVEDARAGPGRRRPGMLVVVKPTSLCNAACVYCCAHHDAHGPAMTMECVQTVLDRLAEYARSVALPTVRLLWHGGEPLLMGQAFYREAFARAAAVEKPRFTHDIQSNLLLLDDEWIELLREAKVAIGSSVDPIGPDRVMKDGQPQLPLWMEKFTLGTQAGLKIGIVFVVTPVHLGRAAEVYAWFRDLEKVSPRGPTAVRMNPMYPAGAAATLDDEQVLRPADYGAFLLEMRTLWERDGRPFPLSPIDMWVDGSQPSCDFSEDCSKSILGIDAAGRVFSCGRTMDDGDAYGDLATTPLETILEGAGPSTLARRARTLRAGPCRDCAHWDACHGGCPYMAKLVHGSPMRKTPFCEAYTACLDALAGPAGS